MWKLSRIISGLLTLTGFIGAFTVLAATRLAQPGGYADPFAPYEAFMPGQPVTANPPTFCMNNVSGAPGAPHACDVNPHEVPPFISVTASPYNGRFQQTRFLAAGLYVGDIVQHWGRPDSIVSNGRLFYLQWHSGLSALIEPDEHGETFDYMLSVKWLTVWVDT